jgi:neutral ceramidase
MIDKTFLTVEKKKNDTWETVLTDHDYETRYTDWFDCFFIYILIFLYRFYWKYTHQLLGMSVATIEWHVADDTETGVYRIGYFGNHRSSFKK